MSPDHTANPAPAAPLASYVLRVVGVAVELAPGASLTPTDPKGQP